LKVPNKIEGPFSLEDGEEKEMENQIHTRSELITLIKSLIGHPNVLTIPRELSRFLGDDLPAALFLSQLIYWQGKQGRADGAIYKTYREWYEETGLTEYQVRRCMKKKGMSEFLSTKIHRANGSPTVHYYLDMAKFSESILKFLKNRNQSLSRIETKVSQDSLTEVTPMITPETTTGIEEEEEETLFSPEPAADAAGDIISFFQENFGEVNRAEQEKLQELVTAFPPERVKKWISAAAEHRVEAPMPYICTCLEKDKSSAEEKEKSAFKFAPNVFLTDSEVLDLVDRFGSGGGRGSAEARIHALSLYKENHDEKKYKSDYAEILLWSSRNGGTWDPGSAGWHIVPEWLDSLWPKPAPSAAPESGYRYREWDPKRHSRVSGNFVICGYTGSSSVGSLIVGLPTDGRYECCGLVGRGLTKTGLREELYALVKDIKTENSPFPREELRAFMDGHSNLYGEISPGQRRITWVRPLHVVRVESKFTNRHQVYEGSFKGLRPELKPEDLTGEMERLRELARK
jgi:hypothetical protein